LSWKRFAALGLVAAAYLTLRLAALGELGVPIANQYMSGAPAWERWMTSGRVFLRYLRLVAAPVDVAGSYEFNSIPMANLSSWDAWLGLASIALGVFLAVRISKTRPIAGFAILFFLLSLLPVSSWFMPIGVLMAERFLYTPMFGVALLAGLAWGAIEQRSVRQLAGAGALAIAVLLCISHNLVWADDFTFYRNLTRVLPNNVVGRLGYASGLQSKGRTAEAQDQLEAGLRVAPASAPVLANLAQLLVETDPRKCPQARPLLERALKSRPGYWLGYWVLGNCEAMEGNREKADEDYGRAAENIPFPDANLLFSWGLTREKLGKQSEAIDLYRRAATINPSDLEIQHRLAVLTGRPF
jgi:tetratricopeptide (TPR) repeat protein